MKDVLKYNHLGLVVVVAGRNIPYEIELMLPSPSSSLGGVVVSYLFWRYESTCVITFHYLEINIYIHILSILICFIYIGHHMYVLLYGHLYLLSLYYFIPSVWVLCSLIEFENVNFSDGLYV